MVSAIDGLTGKVAIVTGASGQIGQVIARDFLDAGSRVAWVGRRQGELEAAIDRLSDGRDRSLAVRADLRSEPDVRRMVRAVLKHFGQIDILVNNAAQRGPTAPATQLGLKDWRVGVGTNLSGAVSRAPEGSRQVGA